MNVFKAAPTDAVGCDYGAEETRNVAQPVGFVTMNRVVVVVEALLEETTPHAVQLAQTLSDVPVEFAVRSLLRATLDDHVA